MEKREKQPQEKPAVKITMREIIEKREQRWEERHDLEFDRKLVEASAVKILSSAELRDEVISKPWLLIPATFYIVDKKGHTVPFFLNEVQKDIQRHIEEDGSAKPFFILKGRQQGVTSFVTAVQLAHAITKKNFAGFTLADRDENTKTIFNDKARVVHDRLPDVLKPHDKFNSTNELFFDKLNSSWRVATATENVGRSRTLNFVHFSEIAFYNCSFARLQAGIGEAIADGAITIYETTANGWGDAKDLWDSGACNNLFYEWWRSAEYRSTEYHYLDTENVWLQNRLKLLEELGCDKEQRTWYAKKFDSYLDKALIRQEYPITPEEAFISSGESLFDLEAINTALVRARSKKPSRRGYFTYRRIGTAVNGSDGRMVDTEWKLEDIRFVEDPSGYITIHEEPEVKLDGQGNVTERAPYVLGGDTAGEGEDYFTAKVICNIDGRTVATLHKQRMDEDLYAEQVYCLGRMYHDALIAVEINFSRHSTRVLSQKYSYPHLYLRETMDGMQDKMVTDYGFLTTSKTKPVAVHELVAFMRDNPNAEPDENTLREMTTFVRRGNGYGALDGYHDDLVMALAIAHFASRQQEKTWIKVEAPKEASLAEIFHVSPTSDQDVYMDWEDL